MQGRPLGLVCVLIPKQRCVSACAQKCPDIIHKLMKLHTPIRTHAHTWDGHKAQYGSWIRGWQRVARAYVSCDFSR